MMTVNPRAEGPADTSPGSDDETPTDDHEKGAGRRLPMPPEEEEEDGVAEESGAGATTAQPSQVYVMPVFTDSRPARAPKNEMADVTYTEVKVQL